MKTNQIRQTGFTLVEIMIVVAIIGLLAAIAIPNILRSRISANENAIRMDLRTFSSAAQSFRAQQQPSPIFPPDIEALSGATPTYLDATWNQSGTLGKHGFRLTYTRSEDGSSFTMIATPITGEAVNTYCLDHTGTIVTAADGISGNAEGCQGGAPIN